MDHELQRVPDSVNNNYKMSIEDVCDKIDCDKNDVDDSIYEFHETSENFGRSENFESMAINRMVKYALHDCSSGSIENAQIVNNLLEQSGAKLFNINFLLGKNETEPFLKLDSICNLESFYCESDLINSPIVEEETKDEPSKPSQKFTLTLHSVKMAALKDILQAKDRNSGFVGLF